MRVRRLQTSGFRNLEAEPVDVDAPLVAFWGENGQGKTNLLEAVGMLGALRSFRTSRVGDLVAPGARAVAVEASVDSEGMCRRHRWSNGEEGRRLEREERQVDSRAWLQGLRATWFAPEDVAIVRGEPALRRALLDRTVLTVDPDYLDEARVFRRLLDQKAAALREGASDALLDVLDEQLAGVGTRVSVRRRTVVDELGTHWSALYRALAGEEAAEARLRSWAGSDDVESYRRRLGEQRAGERAGGKNLGGAQRDDIVFSVTGLPARTAGSQGQARSLVLAWKLCELVAARARHGEAPLFLLDDLGSELDARRTAALMEILRGVDAQVFLTTTDLRFVPAATGLTRRVEVVRGRAIPG